MLLLPAPALNCNLRMFLRSLCRASRGKPNGRHSWSGGTFASGQASVSRERYSLFSPGRLIDGNFDRPERSIRSFIGWIVRNDVLGTEIANDLVRDLRELRYRSWKKCATAGFGRQLVDKANRLFARTLPDEACFAV